MWIDEFHSSWGERTALEYEVIHFFADTVGWGGYATVGRRRNPHYPQNKSLLREKFLHKVNLKIQIKECHEVTFSSPTSRFRNKRNGLFAPRWCTHRASHCTVWWAREIFEGDIRPLISKRGYQCLRHAQDDIIPSAGLRPRDTLFDIPFLIKTHQRSLREDSLAHGIKRV